MDITQKSTVTAIMPTCGRTTCIGESVFSFINQTYPYKKLIILDTHPQDIKFNIKLPDSIAYLKGSSKSFSNLGDKYRELLKMVDTELFCIWEDDDLWLPTHIEWLVNTYKSSGDSEKPRKFGNLDHFTILGGGEKPVYKIAVDRNVSWCRFLFENKNLNIDTLQEPFDVSFVNLFDTVWAEPLSPTYIYRWDNGQCHMSGLYGQMGFNELYRFFEDALSKVDISNKIVSIKWNHDYKNICKV